jgi:hypothetical protein
MKNAYNLKRFMAVAIAALFLALKAAFVFAMRRNCRGGKTNRHCPFNSQVTVDRRYIEGYSRRYECKIKQNK